MGIAFTRIDNRLIHGQVAQGWLPGMAIDEVIVISKDAASSSLMQRMMRMALPQSLGLKIFDPSGAAQYLKNPPPARGFLLIENFEDLKFLVDSGVKFDTVNIGNTKYEQGKKEFGTGVFLSEHDLMLARVLADGGIKFDVRALPSSLSKRLV